VIVTTKGGSETSQAAVAPSSDGPRSPGERWSRPEGASDHATLQPERRAEDIAVLEYMLAALRGVLARHATRDASEPAVTITHLEEPAARRQRVVLVRPGELATTGPLTVTGFFGHRRAGADKAVLHDADGALLEEFPGIPHLLSYSSLELADGNYANLVLWSDPAGLAHIRQSARHARASHELAPGYYETVRIHAGSLSRGIHEGTTVTLASTKYFDFRDA
jgi:hypothetical protein